MDNQLVKVHQFINHVKGKPLTILLVMSIMRSVGLAVTIARLKEWTGYSRETLRGVVQHLINTGYIMPTVNKNGIKEIYVFSSDFAQLNFFDDLPNIWSGFKLSKVNNIIDVKDTYLIKDLSNNWTGEYPELKIYLESRGVYENAMDEIADLVGYDIDVAKNYFDHMMKQPGFAIYKLRQGQPPIIPNNCNCELCQKSNREKYTSGKYSDLIKS